MFDHAAITAAPAYDLATCVALAPKNEDSIDDADDAVRIIKERFERTLYLCDEAQLAFVRFAAELSEKRGSYELPDRYYPFSAFCGNDFVYLFANDDAYFLVLPDELAQILHEVTARENFAPENAKNSEMNIYANALLNLYGAYEVEQFAEVWNHHHKDKITFNEAQEFLTDMMYFHSDYWIDEDFVVHDCLFDDDFDELWEETNEKPYYMPTKSVIRALWNRGYEFETKINGENEMNAFLAQYVPDEQDLEDVQYDVLSACERLSGPAEVRRDLEEAGIELTEEFVSQFEKLFQTLRDNTHIWELRGFTPYQYTIETGKQIPRFKLPQGKAKKQK